MPVGATLATNVAAIGLAFAIAWPATTVAAAPLCRFAVGHGTVRYGSCGGESGWRELGCDEASPAKDAAEPALGFPYDPGKVLRDGERAGKYRCHMENETRRKTCIRVAEVLANGEVRASELLVGRPERLRASGINLVVDCRTGEAELQNRDGTALTTALSVSDEATRALAKALCAVQRTAARPSLRMF